MARSWARAPLRWACAAALLLAPVAVSDLTPPVRELVEPARAVHLLGTVVRVGDPLVVEYVQPGTQDRIQVDVPAVHRAGLRPDRAGPVALVVDRLHPAQAYVAGDAFPAWHELASYAWVPLVPLLVGVLRARRAGTVRRLQGARVPTYSMVAALTGPASWGRRCVLHLYALDARAGDSPVCAVPLVTTSGLPLDVAVVAEVKGSPRPHGLCLARVDGVLLRPAGRALARRGAPRPGGIERVGRPATVAALPVPAPVDLPLPRRGWWLADWRTGVLAAGLVLLAVVGVRTALGAAQAGGLYGSGLPVLVRAVAVDADDFTLTVAYDAPDGREVRTLAPVDYPEDFPLGLRYPAVVDPDDPQRLRLSAERYDAVEPVTWGALPAVVGAGLVLDLAVRRRAARGAGGTWREVDVRTQFDGLTVHPCGSDQVVCRLEPARVQHADLGRVGTVHRAELAGLAAPGSVVAVRLGGTALALRGPAALPGPPGGRPVVTLWSWLMHLDAWERRT